MKNTAFDMSQFKQQCTQNNTMYMYNAVDICACTQGEEGVNLHPCAVKSWLAFSTSLDANKVSQGGQPSRSEIIDAIITNFA